MDALCLQQVLSKPINEVWDLISSDEGMKQFFAPHVAIDLSVDGLLDVWFFPENPVGLKGAESMRVLAFEAPRRLLFTWNQPPFLSTIKNQRTVVEFSLLDHGETTTIQLTHSGWGKGGEWSQAKAYFSEAWLVVLDRLAKVCQGQKVDWILLLQGKN